LVEKKKKKKEKEKYWIKFEEGRDWKKVSQDEEGEVDWGEALKD